CTCHLSDPRYSRLHVIVEWPLACLEHEQLEQPGRHCSVPCFPLLPPAQGGLNGLSRFRLGQSCIRACFADLRRRRALLFCIGHGVFAVFRSLLGLGGDRRNYTLNARIDASTLSWIFNGNGGLFSVWSRGSRFRPSARTHQDLRR